MQAPPTTRTTPPIGRNGFSLLELLIVIAIIGLLIAILLPSFEMFRQRARKVSCMSNLKQVGYAIEVYKGEYQEHFPTAKYMPDPFLSADPDASLLERLAPHLNVDPVKRHKLYHCPGDRTDPGPFSLSKSSYMYQSELSGQRVEELFPVKYLGVPVSRILVARDFDGGTFDLTPTGTVTVDFFHDLRNLLFADGRVGNFE